MNNIPNLIIYVDGASRGNPGPASCAYLFIKNKTIIHQKSIYLGNATNNIAEYKGIINALRDANAFTNRDIELYSDSELVINQINKIYRIKKKHLSVLFSKVNELALKFDNVEFKHIRRDKGRPMDKSLTLSPVEESE